MALTTPTTTTTTTTPTTTATPTTWKGFGVSRDGTVARRIEGAPAGLRVRSGLAGPRRAAPPAGDSRACRSVAPSARSVGAPRPLPTAPAGLRSRKGATSGRVQRFPKRGERRPSPPRPLCSLPLAGVVSWRASTFSMGGAVGLADRWNGRADPASRMQVRPRRRGRSASFAPSNARERAWGAASSAATSSVGCASLQRSPLRLTRRPKRVWAPAKPVVVGLAEPRHGRGPPSDVNSWLLGCDSSSIRSTEALDVVTESRFLRSATRT